MWKIQKGQQSDFPQLNCADITISELVKLMKTEVSAWLYNLAKKAVMNVQSQGGPWENRPSKSVPTAAFTLD
jgi:hypothetical protein